MEKIDRQGQKIKESQFKDNSNRLHQGLHVETQSETFPLWQKIVGVAFGFIFISVVLALAVWMPELKPQQYAIIKTVLALAAAGIAGIFSGFIEVNGQTSKFAIRAGGAIAVFIIVFFFTPEPPKIEKVDDTNSHTTINQISSGAGTIQIGENNGELDIGAKVPNKSSNESGK